MMTDPRSGQSRREVVIRGVAAALATVVAAPAFGQRTGSMTIYRDAGCGCCLNWVAHARRAGFSTRVIDAPDMAAIKRRLGVPAALWACHTAIASGLVVEGHVPLDRVTALLQRRPPTSAALPFRECRWARRAWNLPMDAVSRSRFSCSMRQAVRGRSDRKASQLRLGSDFALGERATSSFQRINRVAPLAGSRAEQDEARSQQANSRADQVRAIRFRSLDDS